MGTRCQRSFNRATHQILSIIPIANFDLFMNLPDPSVAHRFVRDVAAVLVDRFAGRLFRILRGRAFRRQVRKRVAARLVLSKSRLADLPAELVRCVCVEWL
jgi:hypothetical protein